MKKDATPPAKTIQLQIHQLVPGLRLERDVLSDDGTVLVRAGTQLSRHTLTKLDNWNIPSVTVAVEAVVNPIVDPNVQQFVNSYNRSVTVIQKAFENLRASQEIQLETFSETANDLTDTVLAAGNIVDKLYSLPPCDDVTFQHSVNVSVIAALIASWLDYPTEMINAISLTGLLHDVGKSQLPVAILNQTNRLPPQDYEHYKRHVGYGFELIRNQPNLGDSIRAGIIQHHERYDGSGYPYRLSGDRIHPFASIVAIADVYDEALTINRDSAAVYSPYSGLENVYDQKHCLEPQTCLMFNRRMLNFLSGNVVALSDGRRGRVVCLNQASPSRSMVQLTDGSVLDLETEPDIRIHHVIR